MAGVALSTANKITENAIAESKASILKDAIKTVTPQFDNNPIAEQYKVVVAESDSLTIYPVKMGDKWVGSAVESYTKNGFSGLIRVMVGFDAENKLYNYTVLEHHETPGLGSKMESWFRANKNRQCIIGRNMTDSPLKVTKDDGDIDAITAATISSRAFLEAINLAYTGFSGYTDTVSSATALNPQ
jgi:electron transport complex protein RnfG